MRKTDKNPKQVVIGEEREGRRAWIRSWTRREDTKKEKKKQERGK